MSFTAQQVQILKSKLLEKVKEKNETDKKQLNILTINYLNFQKIQPVIKTILQHHFADIVELKINNCDLRTLENFPHLPQLTDLSVAKNSLQGSFQFIVKNRRIKYIDASDNIIKDIRKFQPLKRFKKVSLYAKNNPFLANTSNLIGKQSIASKLQLIGITLLDKSKEADAAKIEAKKQKEESKKIIPNTAGKAPKAKEKKRQIPNNNLFTIRTSRNQDASEYNHQRIREILRLCRQSDYNSINSDDMRLYRRLPLSIQRASSIHEGLQNMRRRTQALNSEGRDNPILERHRSRQPQYFHVLDGIREQFDLARRNRSPPRRSIADVWASQQENDANEDVPLIQRNSRQSNNSEQRAGSENILWQNSPPRLEIVNRNEEDEEDGEDPLIDEISSQDLQNEEEEGEDEEEPHEDLSYSSISSPQEVQMHLGNDIIDHGELLEDSQIDRRIIFDVFNFPKQNNQENEQDR